MGRLVYKLADGGRVIRPTGPTGEVVAIGDRGGVPRHIRYEHPGDGTHPGVEIGIEVVEGVPWVTFVALLGEPGARRVKAADVKAVAGRLEDLVESALSTASYEQPKGKSSWLAIRSLSKPNAEAETMALPEIRRARKRANRKVTSELLQQVADVYRKGDPAPTEAVRRAFGCSHRTAARYVQLARDAGLLSSTTQGKASK